MDPDLLPTLVSYYQQSQRTKELAYKFDLKKHAHTSLKSQAKSKRLLAENEDLRTQIEESKLNLSNAQTTADVRQREIESLRSRHQDTDKADKAHAQALKVQADSYKQELSEIRDDLKRRDEELRDLRQDALDREDDLKQTRELTRSRDKELKEARDQLRAKENEVRKANHTNEKLQLAIERLEQQATDARYTLEAAQEALAEAEDKLDALQAQRQLTAAQPRPVARVAAKVPRPAVQQPLTRPQPYSPAIADDYNLAENNAGEESEAGLPSPVQPKKKSFSTKPRQQIEPETDYNEPPSKPTKKAPAEKSPVKKAVSKKSTNANKENQNLGAKKASKKRKTVDDFSASPPRSSPPPASPPRKKTKKPDFSMTPFVDKTSSKSALSMIPLSPPSALAPSKRAKDQIVPLKDDEPKPKKKRKLLGGAKTLMDDTPKKVTKMSAKTNFGKDLSPLKRPISSAGLIIKD